MEGSDREPLLARDSSYVLRTPKADFLEKYKDDIVYVKSTETGKKYPIGIKLKGNAWVEKTGWYPDTCVVGLAEGLKNKDLAVKFIEENILED